MAGLASQQKTTWLATVITCTWSDLILCEKADSNRG